MEETALAKRIKQIKKNNGLTNEDLADISGLPVSNVSKLLAGVSKHPTIDTIGKIAKALNVSIDYLVFGSDASGTRTGSSDEYQILETYRVLNASGKDEMMKYGRLLEKSQEYRD